MPAQAWVERANRVIGLEEPELKLEVNKNLVHLANLMDEAFQVPGTSLKFGLDGLIGLVPILGDVVTALFGLLMLREARRLGLPKSKQAVMIGYYVIDVLGGLVPLVGDLFDFAFKANKKTIRLLQAHLDGLKRRRQTAGA